MIEPLASALEMSFQELMKSNKQGNENEEYGSCIVDVPYFKPFKTYPSSKAIDSLPSL